MLHAVVYGQWSPWLTAAIGIPWLGLVWAAKPSVGLAYFAGWPSRAAVIGGAALTLLAFVVWPGWVPHWLDAARSGAQYIPTILRPGGFLALLAFFRWRQPEARWLGVLSLVPQCLSMQDLLPTLLIARTRRELALLMLCQWVALVLIVRHVPFDGRDIPGMLERQWPYLLVGAYLPALALLLLRRGKPAEAAG